MDDFIALLMAIAIVLAFVLATGILHVQIKFVREPSRPWWKIRVRIN